MPATNYGTTVPDQLTVCRDRGPVLAGGLPRLPVPPLASADSRIRKFLELAGQRASVREAWNETVRRRGASGRVRACRAGSPDGRRRGPGGIGEPPQLAGRVIRTDLTGGDGEDCIPHGTVVASIIAASDARARGIPFYGVAPAARILSIRVQQQEGTGGLTNAQRRKTLLNIANGIRYAVVKHAQVINVSIQVSASYPALRSAVEFALRRNVVVVAAAGNDSPGGGQGPFY